MTDLGLIIYDEQSFFSRVIKAGTEQGIFTRDRADEIIKVAVAMANKYVLEREVDFRSEEELGKVQETIVKLIAVGLEIRSKGDVEAGISILMSDSPVSLFRVAFTRIEKLRIRWRKLLQDHKITIMVTQDEYACLSDLTCQRLSQMSIFTDSELYTIESLTLQDELFSNLGLLEYYENEAEKYEFILKLRSILPFDLLNKSPNVKAENLSEVDSIRESIISTLIISARIDSEDPVAVTMPQVREFLSTFADHIEDDPFTDEMENAVLDVIQELGSDLNDDDGSMLTREIIRIAQKLMDIIVSEWGLVNSDSETVFYKRWSRLVILSDAPDVMERILTSDEMIDEFDFDIILSRILGVEKQEALDIINRLPWKQFAPDQIMRLFQECEDYQKSMADTMEIDGFTAAEFVDLIDEFPPSILKRIIPRMKSAVSKMKFSLEELQLLADAQFPETLSLIRSAGPPASFNLKKAISEFSSGSERHRQIVFHSSVSADYFSTLFKELWLSKRNFVKKQIKLLSGLELADVFERLVSLDKEKITEHEKDGIQFCTREFQEFYDIIPKTKKNQVDKCLADIISQG